MAAAVAFTVVDTIAATLVDIMVTVVIAVTSVIAVTTGVGMPAMATAVDMRPTTRIPATAPSTPKTVRVASTSAIDFDLAKAPRPNGWGV
jgi:hypothetical protein